MERITHVKHSWGIAIRALQKNRLQTALTMTGMTIGVATVLTMIALGTGAQSSIQDQVRAAGMNLIIVTAGNWNRGDDSGGASMSSNRPGPRLFASPAYVRPTLMVTNFDLRMTPAIATGAGRLARGGGSWKYPNDQTRTSWRFASGTRAAVNLTPDDVEALRSQGRPVRFGWIYDDVHITVGQTQC